MLLIFVVGPIGCSDTDEYEILVYEDQPAYMISGKGDFSNERFDTVFVFGHIDNESVAKELTQYLNEQEPDEPFRYRRFYPDDDVKGP